MNVTALIGVRWFSTAAGYGAGSIVLWILAAFLFFIPMSLICAEFASTFPNNKGGMIDWIKEILGEKAAFYSSWLYYVSWYFYYPSLLTFGAIALAYALNPALANNKTYITVYVIIAYWLATLICLQGAKTTSKFAKFGGFFGNILPIFVVLIIAGISVFLLRKPIPTDYSLVNWIPRFNNSNIMFLSTLTLAMGGAELTSSLAINMKNPKKDYPKAIFFSGLFVCLAYILGTVSLTFVLAPDQIGAASGILSIISIVTKEMGTAFIGSIICLLTCLAGIVSCVVVILATVKMFIEGNGKNLLPKFLVKENKKEVPVNLVILQAIIITVIMILSSTMSSVELIYSILVLMATILMFIPYLFLIVAYIKMKFNKQRNKYHTTYRVPGKKIGAAITTIVLTFTTLATILIPILSPPGESKIIYELELIGGPILFFAVGMILYRRSKRKNKISN